MSENTIEPTRKGQSIEEKAEELSQGIVDDVVEKFQEVMEETDPVVSLILRAHLLFEQTMDDMICHELTSGYRVIDEGRLSFNQKVELAHSFDVVSHQYIVCLRKLNALRNRCVHRRGYAVTQADADDLSKSIQREIRERAPSSFDSVYKLVFFSLALIFVHISSYLYKDTARKSLERDFASSS